MSITTEEKIAVMQAFLEGKTIEIAAATGSSAGTWDKITRPAWDWLSNQYRVKPEPKEFYAIVYTSSDGGEFYSSLRLIKEEVETRVQDYVPSGGIPAARVIKLREVLDES